MSLLAIPAWLRAIILGRDDGQCRYCHMRQYGQRSPFHIDHVRPRSRGGATREDNLALQCPHCSGRKAAKVAGADPATGQVTPLFHPLQQQWADHFELRRDGRCVGRDPVGRATVEALAMNRPNPADARAIQIALGLLAATAGAED